MHEQNELQIQMYLSIMLITSAMVHLVIGIYFAYIGIYSLVILSIVDIMIYAVAFFINKVGRTRIASFIFVFKIISYSLISTFLFGTNVNVHWFILIAILPTALYLNFTELQKICILVSMPLLVNLQLFLPMIYPPPFNMEGNTFLKFFFANILGFGVMIELILNDVIARRLADLHAKSIKNFENMSNIDPLTSLNNRRYAEHFFEMLNDTAMNMPCLICLMDIDDFKAVNDTYGHDAGDVVLKAISGILRQYARQSDLVCRWGGEEFLIGLLKCDVETGRIILEKIRKAIEDEMVHTALGKISVTVTGGASVLNDEHIKTVLDDCDKKLYDGKRSGKNKIVI